jgi:hypothetical protein
MRVNRIRVCSGEDYGCRKQIGLFISSKSRETTSIRVVPASYNTVVEYDSVEYSLSSSETYYKYRDKIGKTAKGKLETKRYDDGSMKIRIVSLE